MQLLERDVELSSLTALLRETAAGRGSVVSISGEAGVGKTTLVEEHARTSERDARLIESLFPSPEAVEACCAAGILVRTRGALAFRHELARLAVEQALDSMSRASLHREVLRTVEQRAEPARLAHHAAAAGDTSAALRYSLAAAERARTLRAHRAAAEHYEAALQHGQRLTPSERAPLLERFADELQIIGRVEEGAEAVRNALQIWKSEGDALGAGRAMRIQSRYAWLMRQRDEAERLAGEAIAILEALPPGPELAMAYSAKSHLEMLDDNCDEAIAIGRRAIELAERFDAREILMSRLLSFIYGVVGYLVFFVTFLYAIGFVGNIVVPKSIDTGATAPLPQALIINSALLMLFAVQHSVMARPWFKRWWTQFVSPAVERSTFVLFASVALIVLYWQWRPMPQVIWSLEGAGAVAMNVIFWSGWGLVLLSTFMISHFHLFGLQQVHQHLQGRKLTEPQFDTRALYRYMRHPIMAGFFLAFWAAPVMTLGHLLFAVATSGYILVALQFEERDLIRVFGARYEQYRREVRMFIPIRRSGRAGREVGIEQMDARWTDASPSVRVPSNE